MLIFVVVVYYINGDREERAFAFPRAARTYAAARGEEAKTVILEVPVIGAPDRHGFAYTIRWDDATPDSENVEAVYGNGHEARHAAGCHGQVRQLRIDLSADGADTIGSLPDRGRKIINLQQAREGTRRNRMQRMR